MRGKVTANNSVIGSRNALARADLADLRQCKKNPQNPLTILAACAKMIVPRKKGFIFLPFLREALMPIEQSA